VVHACPEIARQTMLFFMDRSRAPKGPPDHSIPILVAPVVIARQWLQVSGDIAFLQAHPEVMQSLESIMETLLELENKSTPLFPSRYSSDGVVGRRYDYGTNVKVYYTFDSMAYIWRVLGDADKADFYAKRQSKFNRPFQDTMTVETVPLDVKSPAAPTWMRTRARSTCQKMSCIMMEKTLPVCLLRSTRCAISRPDLDQLSPLRPLALPCRVRSRI
jgi:hypothetical protein